MKPHRHHTRTGFSIMPLPIFLVLGIIGGWLIHRHTGSLWFSIVGGIVSVPVFAWILILIFDNPLVSRLQNYEGNHNCPTCHQRYRKVRSMPSDNDNIILECLKCGAKHRFDHRYHWIEKIDPPT